ncbi:MAG: metallophosphoesterase [Actinobacteria bacterium]|uniref:Unannotated protein n=1 Tax=freshwater metagenome TaxID=449393 RepID=A0A6J6RC59_9ZZZZ|nr:metallophosphoesterase [Actinomycetota bacterium]
MRILHLSDTHLTASGHDEDGVDARGSLRVLLHDLRWVPGIDLVVVTGDLADDGSAQGYAELLAQVGAFAAERGAPLICSTGNHDDRSAFTAALGSGHLHGGADLGRLAPLGTTRAASSEVAGVRIVTLDSLVPGHAHGHLDAEQLGWLAEQLAVPHPGGTVLALHHPPISIRPHAFEDVVLDNPTDLAAVIAGSDVHIVLCGHLHAQVSGYLAGVPVWVTPGVVTRLDLTTRPHLVRGVTGAGASVVDLTPDGPTCHTVHARDPDAGREVYVYDPATNDDALEEA